MSNIFAPIIMFTENDNEEIIINDNLKIRKITKKELKTLFGKEIIFKNQSPNSIKNIKKSSIGFWDEIPKSDIDLIGLSNVTYPYYIIEANDLESIKNLVFTLRLINNKTVVCPKGISSDDKSQSNYFFKPFNINQKTFFSTSNILKLQEYEIINVIKNYNIITKSKNDILKKRLNICLDTEQDKHIRFIEAVSIMESILCGNDSSELNFRFSLYGSFILKKHCINISSKDMKEFYTIRSKLVHTGNKKGYTDDKLYLALEYTKIIYFEYLNNNITGKSILEDIERLWLND